MAVLDVDGHYAILGVDPSAPADVIRSAYKDKCREWHPDRNSDPSAPATMALITLAYSVLSDPVRRKDYDRKDPPPPVVTVSAQTVDISDRSLADTVVVTSSRPVTSFDMPTSAGDGWHVEVVAVSDCELHLTFHRDGPKRGGSVTSSSVQFHVDGEPRSVSVTTRAPGAKSTTRTTRPRPVSLVAGASGLHFPRWLEVHGGPLVTSAVLALVAGAMHRARLVRDTAGSPAVDHTVLFEYLAWAQVQVLVAVVIVWSAFVRRTVDIRWTPVKFLFAAMLAVLGAFGSVSATAVFTISLAVLYYDHLRLGALRRGRV